MNEAVKKDDFDDTYLDAITAEVDGQVEEEQVIYGQFNPSPINPVISQADILDALNSNEDGDARLFIALHRDTFCYDRSIDQWFKWKGHYWEEDKLGDAMAALDAVIEQYLDEAGRQAAARLAAAKNQKKDDEKKAEVLEKELTKRIHDLQTLYRKKNVLILSIQGSGSLGITGAEWDKDPWLLACKNGVIDLKTGEIRPGIPQEFIRTAIPTEWEGVDKRAPTWEKFIMEIFEGNELLVKYVQRLFGYSITGQTTDHIIPILWGQHGRNGKGTMLETLAYVLGSIAGPIQAEMLLSDGRVKSSAGPSPDIMSLRGRRLAWASETEEGRKLAVEKVKFFTGGDTLVGRPPHGKTMIEFTPTHKLFLLTNHRPEVPATEYALWQRMHLIPLNLSYVDEPEKDFERKRDPNLPEKLKAEASGIFAWLVRGCLEWQQIGLNPPQIVKEAIAQYQDDEDILGHFLNECTEETKREKARAGALFNAYRNWCKIYGHEALGGRKFGERMKERFKKKTDQNGNYYEGIILTDSFAEQEVTGYS